MAKTAAKARLGAAKAPPGRGAPAGRAGRSAARREAILAAALEEFTAAGFAAARLDDIARRAGVAKGTIYLHFADKDALFQELVRAMLNPVVGGIVSAAAADIPVRQIAEQVVELFLREIFATRRKDVIRLIISEGPRFPKLAEFYYREVLSRIIGALRPRLERAVARGEISRPALARFPQLLGAPAVMAIVWDGLFGRFEPLDVRALMHAYLDILFDGGAAS